MSEKHKQESWNSLRKAVFTRDKHQCINCLGTTKDGLKLDPDHSVPRGVGGSDRLSNLNTLCRRCHSAKHGDGIAPTVRIESTKTMSSVEFCWFKHLLQEILPTLAQSYDVRLIPKFKLAEREAWYLPLGDLRRLDQQLYESDLEYSSLRTQHYM